MSTDEKWAQVSKGLGDVTDQTRKVTREICEAAWAAGHDIWFVWGDGATMDHMLNHTQRHPVVDLMVHNKAAGDWTRGYIWENRARILLRHVIWNHKITSTVVSPGVVRQMADRGDPTANHEDHNHFECFEGTYIPPSGSSGPPKIDTSEPLDLDGDLGPKTIAKWQYVMGTKVDGVIDNSDSDLVKAVQRRLQLTVDASLVVDGNMGPRTIRSLQRYLKSPVDGYISKPRSQVILALQRRLNEGRF